MDGNVFSETSFSISAQMSGRIEHKNETIMGQNI